MDTRTHKIYAFIDTEGRPFYIGRTYMLKKRIKEHYYEIRHGNTLPKYNKMRKILEEADGKDIFDYVIVLEDNISDKEIDNREIFWIKKYREAGYSLKNLTDGGGGALNTIPGLSEKLSKLRKGKKLSEETKLKISKKNKGRKFTQAHKENLSISRRKRKISEETRMKASVSSKGRINIKVYELISPDGEIHKTFEGVTKFCEQRNLTSSNIFKVIHGHRDNHKGWRVHIII